MNPYHSLVLLACILSACQVGNSGHIEYVDSQVDSQIVKSTYFSVHGAVPSFQLVDCQLEDGSQSICLSITNKALTG